MHHARVIIRVRDSRVKRRPLTSEERDAAAEAWRAVQPDVRRVRAVFGRDADEVESAAAWRISSAISSYDPSRGSLAGWARAALRTAVLDHLRRRRLDRRARVAADLVEAIVAGRDAGRERIARDELAEHVFAGLSRRARLVASARAEGCTLDEAARAAGMRSRTAALYAMRRTAAAARERLADL